jgi:hypothetical protein
VVQPQAKCPFPCLAGTCSIWERPHEITSARVIVTCPGRNFVTLKIETDTGLSGWATRH